MVKRIFPCSIRARLTMVATLVAAVVFAATVGLTLSTLPGNLRGAVQNRVELAVRRVANDARTKELRSLLPTPARVPLLQVVSSEGIVLASSHNLRGQPPIANLQLPQPETIYATEIELTGDSESVEHGSKYLVMAMQSRTSYGLITVYGASSLSDVNRALGWLYALIFLGTPLMLLGVAGITWAAVGHTLRPVERIRAELAEITGHDLSRRVPVPGAGDEISNLAVTTNDTLDRLERSAETQRRFVADASHELRSPITALRTQLEVASAYPDDTDWASTGARALKSADRLTDIIEELLMLARLDAGAVIEWHVVDACQLAEEQGRRRAGGDISVVTHVMGTAPVMGSRIQLDRLLTNLLDNATRHATTRIDLQVAVNHRDRTVDITITDDGAGIAADEREHVFERFTRLAEGRARDKEGSGLGLALSREIAQAHRGTLTITDHYPGAQFVTRLPLYLDGDSPV
ncbi:ATP-binding protein [Nonomuraea sp. NPDC052129]|uniref:sensor histidine kinase n=1 Tax=Nonomuraea sp. NPDC052129 TaxID=3154651 RepID=UPI0034494182